MKSTYSIYLTFFTTVLYLNFYLFELYQHSHFFEAEKLKLRLFRGNVIDAPIYQVGKPCKKDEECTLFKGSKCSKHEGLCYVSEKKPKRLALKILAQ